MLPEPSPCTQLDSTAVRLLWIKVAAELDGLRDELEEIGVSLCADEAVMTRYMNLLQRLDELGQRSCWLAELVRAEDPVARVDDITLHSLMDRLKA